MFHRLETSVQELQRNIKAPRRRARGGNASPIRQTGSRRASALSASSGAERCPGRYPATSRPSRIGDRLGVAGTSSSAGDGPIPKAWIVANIVLGGGLLSTRVGVPPAISAASASLGPTAWPNNCIPARPGLCRLVPRPRLHAPSGQRKWDTRGFSRTGRDGLMRSDNSEVDGSTLAER